MKTNLLHEFFNSESDANKYLTAEQQEDLEKDFQEWYNFEIRDLEFASRPLIQHICEYTHPHMKAIVESDKVELVEGYASFLTDDYIVD